MKKFILEYKRYAQKCPRQLLRSMQKFVLEEHLDILCSEDEIELEELMELGRDEFITIHASNPSSKLRQEMAPNDKKRQNAKVRPYPLNLRTICRRL